MNKMRSRRLGLVIGAVMLLWSQVAAALSYYEPTPRGTVGLSRPLISQQFELEGKERITAAEMWINGRAVVPDWDETGRVYYLPPAPLQPGTYRVRLVVRVAPGEAGYFYAPVEREFSFTVDAGAAAELPQAGPEGSRALERVNRYRLMAGLERLVYDERLAAAALGHARYLEANPAQIDLDGHRERAGQPYFTGETVGDRARYFAYDGGSFEVINFVDRAEDAVDGWMDTIYHRIPLIHPGMTALGYGLAGQPGENVNVVQVGPYARVDAAVRWPGAGQSGVPPLWDGLESPDPLALYPDVPKPVGYPITLTFGLRPRSLRLTRWSLSGPGGEVETLPFDPVRDPHLDDTVALIPAAPLQAGVTYRVQLQGEIDLGAGVTPFDHAWSFTTAPEYRPLLRSRVAMTVGGQLDSLRVEGEGFGSGMAVFLGGLPVRGLEILSPNRFRFQPPTGYRGEGADLLVVTPGGVETIWRSFFTGQEGYGLPSRQPFAQVPLLVRGQYLNSPALLHESGAVLLPEEALLRMGASADRVDPVHRSYWRLGDRAGEYTLNRLTATLGDSALRLALPVQRRGSSTYVDAAFVRGLGEVETQLIAGELFVGNRVRGILDIEGHWGRAAVEQLLGRAIVSGYGDGSFRPNASLSRAAFVKMLVAARGIDLLPGSTGTFGDTWSHWVSQQGYLGAAVAAGIVKPAEYPGLRFEPERPISREEIAVMVARALGLESRAAERQLSVVNGTATLMNRRFSDASTWSMPGYIAEAVEAGIITGYAEADGRYTFQPTRSATRAEAAVMITRAMER